MSLSTESSRDDCRRAKVPHQEHFCNGKTWAMVNGTMDQEEANARADPALYGPSDMPTVFSIINACRELNIDYDNLRFAIRWYAKRNDEAHANISWFVKECEWERLGDKMRVDIQDIPGCYGTEDQAGMRKNN
ncbi:MAG: hypothetical protein LQ350_007878 [Teloschistes chrysophthalmus]|nr:MAG: hypothetical protein LQ350_007878 [Niorma chrysophthalma]